MKRTDSSLASALSVLAIILEWSVIAATGTLVVVVLWGVATRYLSPLEWLHWLVDEPSQWTEEASIYLLMWVALLGAAVAYRRGEHLGFDFVASRLDPQPRRWMAIAAEIVVIAFAAYAMVYGGFSLVSKTLSAGQTTPALDIPMGYIYLAAPISGVFIVLFAVDRLRQLLAGGVPNSDAEPSAPNAPSDEIDAIT